MFGKLSLALALRLLCGNSCRKFFHERLELWVRADAVELVLFEKVEIIVSGFHCGFHSCNRLIHVFLRGLRASFVAKGIDKNSLLTDRKLGMSSSELLG